MKGLSLLLIYVLLVSIGYTVHTGSESHSLIALAVNCGLFLIPVALFFLTFPNRIKAVLFLSVFNVVLQNIFYGFAQDPLGFLLLYLILITESVLVLITKTVR
ncbi:hypothetical protein [Alteromonas sp. 14N.309.X.WAT.G.H12]|uniref:hypothetical protein n=1 Tax=Alteromonas sp. 14N.309.X.WAT.G.H12 TaxID=3120824 RepID=UPI002FD5A3BC